MAMARPIPRLAPVTKATGLFGGGKFGVDGFGNVFHRKGLDEWPPVDQNSGSVGDTARHAFLVILLHQCGQARVVERGHSLEGSTP